MDILNKVITDLIRKGKYLFLIFNDSSSLLFHMGMTGSLIYTKAKENLGFKELVSLYHRVLFLFVMPAVLKN